MPGVGAREAGGAPWEDGFCSACSAWCCSGTAGPGIAISEVTPEDPKLILDDQSVLRVYLRNPGDYLQIATRLRDYLGLGADQIAFLHGNICRRELLVEIDGIRVQ